MISALNALTMTPSRAVLIFKTEERGTATHPQEEALPWWIFGVLGGLLSVWLARPYPGRLGSPGLAVRRCRRLDSLAAFLPGALLGGLVGWFVIRPVNAVLGWFFRGFNRLRPDHGGYGWTSGKLLQHQPGRAPGLWRAARLDLWVFTRAPTGFIPQQDQGRLDRERPVARFGVAAAHAGRRGAGREDHPRNAGRRAHGHHLRHVVPLAGQQLQLRLDVRRPQAVRRAARARADATGDHGQAAAGVAPAGPGCGGHRFPARRRSRASASPAASSSWSRIGAAWGSAALQAPDGRPDPASCKPSPGWPTRPRSSAPTRRSSSWTSTGPRSQSLGVSLNDVNQTLEIYLGSLYVNSFNEFGRHWQVNLQAEGEYRDRVEDINLLQVRNKWGQMVPLGTLVDVARGRRPDPRHALQPLHRRGRSTATCRRISAPARPSQPIDRAGRPRRCPCP